MAPRTVSVEGRLIQGDCRPDTFDAALDGGDDQFGIDLPLINLAVAVAQMKE